jgi:kynurenine formamidase
VTDVPGHATTAEEKQMTDGKPAVPDEQQLLAWFDIYSNWGRWGDDDRLGTLNLITDDKRLEAVRSVQHGTSVSCAWDVEMNSIHDGGRLPAQRMMVHTGLGYASGAEDVPPPGAPRSPDGLMGTASEVISMAFHGRPITHLDALSHIFWKGKMYGGAPAGYVTDRDGALVHDVRDASQGIQSRGVLLDIPSALARDWLDPREPVFPEQLEAAERRQGIRVEPGDILFVRTGEDTRRRLGPWNPAADGSPGLHAACIPWLHDRGVAVLGADGPQEVTPSGYPGVTLPVHALGVVALGLWLIDNCQLEDLAAKCAELRRWHFLLTVAPLRMNGVTGSPVNPIATF